MNVLIYTGNEPYPKVGGMERASDLLAKYLLFKGHSVVFVCRRKNRLNEDFIPSAPVLFLPEPSKFNSKMNKAFFIDILHKNKTEYIIDQNEGGVVGIWGISRSRRFLPENVKLISVLHSSALSLIKNLDLLPENKVGINKLLLPFKRKKYILIRKTIYSKLWNNSDAIVVLSNSFINEFCYFCKKANQSKIFSIPNINTYFNPEANHIKSNEVLFVGRLDNATKGVDRLLEIWKEVQDLFPEWELRIVGDGKDRLMLEQLASELQLKNYSFDGFQNPESFYRRAKIFCMTSTYEGFGLVLTEAMQHGVVPIAFNSYASASDIIENGKDGYLIEPFNLMEYAEKLKLLMSSNIILVEKSNNALISVSKFSFENVGQEWIQLLRTI